MRVLARDEGMGNGGIRDRLDFLDLEDSKVGEPAVEAKQRVEIGAQVFWSRLARSGAIEHPTDRDACNICRFDAEANESACEDVHDQHDPMAAQENRFDAEQVDAPQAVLSQSWVFRSKSKNWDHKFNDLQDSKFIKNKLCDRTLNQQGTGVVVNCYY